MGGDRPSFRRRAGPPSIGGRVLAMGALLLVAAGLLFARSRARDRSVPVFPVIVEVQGAVAQPGLVSVPSPARAHAAILAAGGDPTGMVDATVQPGTRLVVDALGWRAESMDELLVVGLPVDLNHASAAALEAIPGIGSTRAAAIVAERAAGGPFATVDELVRVKGIGPATVDDLRPFVVAER